MRDPSAFNGMKIAIRGVYVSYEHGLYLRGEGCEMVRSAKGNVWPAVINIVLGAKEMWDSLRLVMGSAIHAGLVPDRLPLVRCLWTPFEILL
jgi:hypothetical protein